MNRRWWITIGIIVVALIVIGVMHENGMLDFEWSGLAMIFAALAGPYHMVKKLLIKDKRTEELLEKQTVRRTDEQTHRVTFDEDIEAKKKRIEELNREIDAAETRIKVIEKKKEDTVKEVKKMSVDEMQTEGIDLFGA